VATEDQSSEFIVLKAVHENLLISFVTLVVEDEYSPKAVENSTFLKIVVKFEVLVDGIGYYAVNEFLLLELDAAVKRSFDDLLDDDLVVDQNFIVNADFIEEAGGSDSLVEMGNDEGDVLHEDVLGLHVVEAEESEVLVDREEEPSVDFGEFLLADDLDILKQRVVDALSHVELLEETVVLLLLVVEMVHDGLVEHFLLDEHQRFNVL
jgi:hypothetical protein